jgi:hypothetical protein
MLVQHRWRAEVVMLLRSSAWRHAEQPNEILSKRVARSIALLKVVFADPAHVVAPLHLGERESILDGPAVRTAIVFVTLSAYESLYHLLRCTHFSCSVWSSSSTILLCAKIVVVRHRRFVGSSLISCCSCPNPVALFKNSFTHHFDGICDCRLV